LNDLLRSSTGANKFVLETFANFILRDNETGILSASHGFRADPEDPKELGTGNLKEEESNHQITLEGSDSVLHSAHSILNGSATARYERLFQKSSRSIVGLVQLVLCCDRVANDLKWLTKYKDNQIFEVESSSRSKKSSSPRATPSGSR
jgi:hypothetical protein